MKHTTITTKDVEAVFGCSDDDEDSPTQEVQKLAASDDSDDEDIYDSDDDSSPRTPDVDSSDTEDPQEEDDEELTEDEDEDEDESIDDEDSLTQTGCPYISPHANIDLHAREYNGLYQVCDDADYGNTLLHFLDSKHTLVTF